MATMCPDFQSAVHKVMQKHTAHRHAFDGGRGIPPKGNPSKKLVRACFGSNGLDLTGTLADDLKAIPGYQRHWINID